MKPWNILKRKVATPTHKSPAQQRQHLIERLKTSGATEYEIKIALKKWESDRAALGFKSN